MGPDAESAIPHPGKNPRGPKRVGDPGFWGQTSSSNLHPGPRQPAGQLQKLIDIHADTMELVGFPPSSTMASPRTGVPGPRSTALVSMNPTGWEHPADWSSTFSSRIRAPARQPAKRHLPHRTRGTYSSSEISIRTFWNPEAHPLFTRLDNIDQRQRRDQRGPDRAFEGALYVPSGEGARRPLRWRGTKTAGRSGSSGRKGDGSMGVFSFGQCRGGDLQRQRQPFVMTEGQVRHEPRVIWCAWGFPEQNHGPDSERRGGALAVINSRAVTLSRWIMYRPASDNDRDPGQRQGVGKLAETPDSPTGLQRGVLGIAVAQAWPRAQTNSA